MYKLTLLAFSALFISLFLFAQSAKAEEIHFNNNVFVLKNSFMNESHKGYENEYFLKNENKNDWTKMVGIYYYPDVTAPLKFANAEDKKVEGKENDVLLKFIENKKQNKAALSYLENGAVNGRNFFEYNVYKYEKHPDKGMMVLRYAERFFFISDAEITQIGNKVKENNDEFLKTIVTSPIPPIVEKDVNVD
ncbi:MAG: hypothetical protein ACLSWI_06830 [Candidatus Gastranaerophilaceae bacterium]